MFTQNKYGNLFQGGCLGLLLDCNGEWGEIMNGCKQGIGFSSGVSNRIGHREVGEKGPLEVILEAINMGRNFSWLLFKFWIIKLNLFQSSKIINDLQK